MNYSDFYNKFDKKLYDVERFTNSLGERIFVVRTKTLPRIYMVTGDDYNWELIPLFNKEFDIYADDEIVDLGRALERLANDLQ